MQTVKEMIALAENLGACYPAMRYLATLEPSAPVEQVWEKLHCDNREWIVWLFERTVYLGYISNADLKQAIFDDVLVAINAFDAERALLRTRIHRQYQDRLIAAKTVDAYSAIYDREFLPEFQRHMYALWSTHYVPQMSPAIIRWLHALELSS